MSKLAAICVRVYGPEHDFTKRAVALVEKNKERRVLIPSQTGVEFEALRYDIVGDKYVVKKVSRYDFEGENWNCIPDSERGEAFTVAANSIVLRVGSPVVCHGLKNAAHLNGTIGDVREYNRDKGRFVVHFDDNNLDPVAVKKENLRIVFELPAAAVEYEKVSAQEDATAKDEVQAEEAAAALLAELDLEEKGSNTSNRRKGKKKRGKKNRKK